MFIGAIIVIKPFVIYVKYMNALDSDIAYLNAPELDWIAECSDSVYNPDHKNLLTQVSKNKTVALITTIFLGIWICYSII